MYILLHHFRYLVILQTAIWPTSEATDNFIFNLPFFSGGMEVRIVGNLKGK